MPEVEKEEEEEFMTAATSTAAAKAICSSHINLLPFNSNLFVRRFHFTAIVNE